MTFNNLPSDAPDKLTAFLARWQEIATTRTPTLADMAFEDLVGENPGLALIEPDWSSGSLDFRYIKVGPEHAQRTGKQLEGKVFTKKLYPDAARRAIAAYRDVLNSGEPQYWELMNSVFGSPPIEYVRLLLPLHDDAGKVVAIIGNWVWKDD